MSAASLSAARLEAAHPRVSVVVVHYHTPELLVRCLRHLGVALAGLSHELLWVENGDLLELPSADLLKVRRLGVGANLGYAGGANLGLRAARGQDCVLLNPDVLVEPEAVRRLLNTLEGGAAVAGPRMFWDSERRFKQPPTLVPGAIGEVLESTAQNGGGFARLAQRSRRRSWRRGVHRFWRAEQPLICWRLSGAMLAFSRAAWERVGPFDEGFRLYFEETDWLARAKNTGLRAVFDPRAVAVHLFDQSARLTPQQHVWYAASRLRYERRHGRYSKALSHGLSRLARRLAPAPSPEAETAPAEPWTAAAARSLAHSFEQRSGQRGGGGGGNGPLWVELSPHPDGVPAAGERLESPAALAAWTLPASIAAHHVDELFLRVVNARGREWGPFRLR